MCARPRATLSGSLRVYSSGGAAVYASQTAVDSFRIPAEREQVYIVEAEINGTHETAKVIVKQEVGIQDSKRQDVTVLPLS